MDFLPPAIDKYASSLTTKESDLLASLDRETHANVMMPRMLSGHMQGRILSMISHMLKPMRVLEIGTYTGYSALCLAEGIPTGGILHTIDINKELQQMIESYFKRSGLHDKLRLHIGAALDIIPTLREEFDLVFIDADKENYSNYYQLVFPYVKKGGWIIADNVLWSGKVLDPSEKDKDTLALIAYANGVAADTRVEQVLLPVRDGLMICRKK